MSSSHGGSARPAPRPRSCRNRRLAAKFRAEGRLPATYRATGGDFALDRAANCRKNPPCKLLLAVSDAGYNSYP